jgi:hypothetical protein
MEVRPRRAREAFCRCEQTWARLTRDIVVVVVVVVVWPRWPGCCDLRALTGLARLRVGGLNC